MMMTMTYLDEHIEALAERARFLARQLEKAESDRFALLRQADVLLERLNDQAHDRSACRRLVKRARRTGRRALRRAQEELAMAHTAIDHYQDAADALEQELRAAHAVLDGMQYERDNLLNERVALEQELHQLRDAQSTWGEEVAA
jgi:chromosome segregation ATPase